MNRICYKSGEGRNSDMPCYAWQEKELPLWAETTGGSDNEEGIGFLGYMSEETESRLYAEGILVASSSFID